MKNRLLSIAGLLTVLLVFGFVLPGCATSGGDKTPLTPEQQAERLAADLNAIKAGSAVVEGAKVTLSGEVDLTASLTVPGGVTLDLTADGAMLLLKNGAILTVDGTVDTKNERINIDSAAANPAVINGGGTINLKSKGHLLRIEGKKLTLDGVMLVGLKDNSNSLVRVGEGGELVLKSGAITGNSVTGGDRADGGGVRVDNNGAFTMTGGKISGNSVNGNERARGGGVAGIQGVFTMIGGEISGNSAAGKQALGGGVFGNLFSMQGGTISGNSTCGGVSFGGGVFMTVFDDAGAFTMQGGTIYGSASVANADGNANETKDDSGATVTGYGAAIATYSDTMNAKWGTGGAYTKGGVPQAGGSGITDGRVAWVGGVSGTSDATLIATPAP